LQLINAYQIQLFVQEVHTITNKVSFILVVEHKLNVFETLVGCSRHPGMCVWAAGCSSLSYRVFAICVIVCCTVW